MTEVLVSCSAPKFSMSFFVMVDAEANEGEAPIVMIVRAAAAVAVISRVVFIMSTLPHNVRFGKKTPFQNIKNGVL